MCIKSLISNLRYLSKSASFVLSIVLFCTISHSIHAEQVESVGAIFFAGPPTTTSSNGSGTSK